MKRLLLAAVAFAAIGSAASADPRHDDQGDRGDHGHQSARFHEPYSPPRGFAPRHWGHGERLPAGYWGDGYAISDWRGHRLYAPPRGYGWYRVGNDAVLAGIATGIVAASVADAYE